MKRDMPETDYEDVVLRHRSAHYLLHKPAVFWGQSLQCGSPHPFPAEIYGHFQKTPENLLVHPCLWSGFILLNIAVLSFVLVLFALSAFMQGVLGLKGTLKME